jgi:hypothetical protein
MTHFCVLGGRRPFSAVFRAPALSFPPEVTLFSIDRNDTPLPVYVKTPANSIAYAIA